MRTADYLAVPYILVMTPVESDDGHWVCRAEYPELMECVGEAISPDEAIDLLEETTATVISRRIENGFEVPVPRERLDYLVPAGERLAAMTARHQSSEPGETIT